MNIREIFRKTEKQLLDCLPKILVKKGYSRSDVQVTDDYIYAKGNIPVMLVAHLDTVHNQIPINIYKDDRFNVLWSPQGLGADDRAGVWSILQLVESHKPHVLFTTEEETGGSGAKKATNDLNFCLDDIKFIIELDRQGKDDAVFYGCDNESFSQYITSFGFNKNHGSFSDISILCPIWGIAGVNLSIGYYLQHTKQEHLNLKEMQQTIDKVKIIFNSLPEDGFKYISQTYEDYDDILDDYLYCDTCSICGVEIFEDEICHEDEEKLCCSECYDREYFYCENCDKHLTRDKKSALDGLCQDCFENIMTMA